MDLYSFLNGSTTAKGSFSYKQFEREKINTFYSRLSNSISISDFLDLQKDSQKTLASYSQQNGLSLDSLNNTQEGRAVASQVNVQASLQIIQNFYDMYISPVGNTDIEYRLGKVTGRAPSGTVNSQTDQAGRINTRSLYTGEIKYNTFIKNSLREVKDFYSVLWFPPFVTPDIKKKNVVFQDNSREMTLSQFIEASRKKKKDDKKIEKIDTRLTNGSDYYETFDMKNFLCARSTFTYRAPGFKAINDNIHLLQWILEGVSGIVSTYLTEWDISLYIQEGLVTGTNGLLPEVVSLTHRMADDNPSDIHDNRASSWGILNCAISKAFGHNRDPWFIDTFPLSTFWTQYPEYTQNLNWASKMRLVEAERDIYFPRFYEYAKGGLTKYKNAYGTSVKSQLMFQDFENAALTGYKNWRFDESWKALYTNGEDEFSELDIEYLPTTTGIHKKRNLINLAMFFAFEIETSDSEVFDYNNNHDTQYSVNSDASEGTGTGGMNVPGAGGGGGGSLSGGGKLLFLKLFRTKSSKKQSSMRNAKASGNRLASIMSQGTVNKNLVSNSDDGSVGEEDTIIGVNKQFIDNTNTLGVPQNNPTFYGGPHGYYLSPKVVNSYFEENNPFLRNVPRMYPVPKKNGSFSWDEEPFLNKSTYYFQGPDKWNSSAVSEPGAVPQIHEQSWSSGYARLRQGLHCYSTDYAYLRVKRYEVVKGTVEKEQYSFGMFSNYMWRWYPFEDDKYLSSFKINWPEKHKSGERYHYEGPYWWEYEHVATYSGSLSGWDDYASGQDWIQYYTTTEHVYYNGKDDDGHSTTYSYYVVRVYGKVPKTKVWYWDWEYKPYKRYALHSEPDTNWSITATQVNNSYATAEGNRFHYRWIHEFARLFGYKEPLTAIYKRHAGNEEYQLNVPGGGLYTFKAFFNWYVWQWVYVLMTGNEHRILDKMVDWGRGENSYNYINFLTRVGNEPDCLFRAKVTHKIKPITYWVLRSARYSSSRTKYWYEKRVDYQTYMAVDLRDTDRFFAGIYKKPFSNKNSDGINFWDAAVPSVNSEYTEKRRSPYDIIAQTGTVWGMYNYYNPTYVSDFSRWSGVGMYGKGLFGSLPGLLLDGEDNGPEIFSDKVSVQDKDRQSVSFGELIERNSLKYWTLDYYGAEIVSAYGATWRKDGGVPVYSSHSLPKNISRALINMYLRSTFYRDFNGPYVIDISVKDKNINVTGIDTYSAPYYIASNYTLYSNIGGGYTRILPSDIISFTTYEKNIPINISGKRTTITLKFVDTIKVNMFSGGVYTLCAIDCGPRLLYNQLSSQIAFLKYARDFFFSRDNTGKRIFDFNFVKKIMKGTETSQGFISNRTWVLSDPKKTVIKDPENPNSYVSKEKIYGYNQWIVSARKLFDNSAQDNEALQDNIEKELNFRIDEYSLLKNRLERFMTKDMYDYSSNDIQEVYQIIDDVKNLRVYESFEEFLVSYLNVLYEARKYFINKRCNKQDGTLWACRHLEKMIPLAMASLINNSNNINPEDLTKPEGQYKVSFYEVQNKTKDRIEAVKTGEALQPDRIQTLYIKVEYADEAAYKESLMRVKNKEATEMTVLKVRSWSYVKNPDGSFKKEVTNKGERLKDGWVVKDGPYVYPIKPVNTDYRLESVEFLQNEEIKVQNLEASKNKNKTVKHLRTDIDEAVWPIDWDKLASTEGGILFNFFGGTNIEKIKDLTMAGVKDPIALLCGAKEKNDYWVVPVLTSLPRAIGYQTNVRIKEYIKPDSVTGKQVSSSSSSSPLVGMSAYAMWPIIEEQEDIIPNAGDFALKVAQV